LLRRSAKTLTCRHLHLFRSATRTCCLHATNQNGSKGAKARSRGYLVARRMPGGPPRKTRGHSGCIVPVAPISIKWPLAPARPQRPAVRCSPPLSSRLPRPLKRACASRRMSKTWPAMKDDSEGGKMQPRVGQAAVRRRAGTLDRLQEQGVAEDHRLFQDGRRQV
jgi:hypothetical protein